MTPQDRPRPWWVLNFTANKVTATLLVAGLLLVTIGTVTQLIHGPIRPSNVLVLLWVVVVAITALASVRWTRKHHDQADN